MKKTFRLKLLELCKTRTNKSSRNKLHFYVILADHGMITDAWRATNCRRNFEASCLPTKCTKMKDLSNTWVSTGKFFEEFRRIKEQKQKSRPLKITQWNARPQKKLNITFKNSRNWTKQNLKNCIQIKTVGTLKD